MNVNKLTKVVVEIRHHFSKYLCGRFLVLLLLYFIMSSLWNENHYCHVINEHSSPRQKNCSFSTLPNAKKILLLWFGKHDQTYEFFLSFTKWYVAWSPSRKPLLSQRLLHIGSQEVQKEGVALAHSGKVISDTLHFLQKIHSIHSIPETIRVLRTQS